MISTGIYTGFSSGRQQAASAGTGRARAVLFSCVLAGISLVTAAGIAAAGQPGFTGAAQELLSRAESGDSWAQLNLGAALDHGLPGYPHDPALAVFWYRRAAAAGLAEAQFNLAHCLATGSGVVRDESGALSWMLKAAGQGLPSAQFLAGAMLVEGMGAPADPVRARFWLRRAAAGGNSDAAVLLGRMQELSAGD